ncbi:hypothetical protein ACD591_16300 [Rufibacter glacialis]|nr:hypothetical protein [Rufibacter glacialis]GGK58894.1 hypothetical protein GCM10011405_03650 [Rufibacter glacialis]
MKDPACTLLLMGKELSNRKMINQQDYDYLKGIYLRDVPATAEEIEDLKEYYLTKLKACCSWYATPDEARERILSLIIRLEHLNP